MEISQTWKSRADVSKTIFFPFALDKLDKGCSPFEELFFGYRHVRGLEAIHV